MIAAVDATKGMVYLAARHLGCTPKTVFNYAKRYPTIQQAIDDNRGKVLDVAEVKLYDAILAGEHWAIAFALKTIGRKRGYVERSETDWTSDGKPITFRVIYDDEGK